MGAGAAPRPPCAAVIHPSPLAHAAHAACAAAAAVAAAAAAAAVVVWRGVEAVVMARRRGNALCLKSGASAVGLRVVVVTVVGVTLIVTLTVTRRMH